MKYPAHFLPDTGGYVVTFRDIPEAITQGDNEVDATEMAKDVLLSAIDVYFERKRAVPMPSKPKKGERVIALPVSVSAKILLFNEMLAQAVIPAELARRMGTSRKEVIRLINLEHTTRIDRIQDALAALGQELELVVS